MSETTATRLERAGLVGPVFDRAAIDEDVKGRFELDASLNPLIGDGDAPQPREFDPEDPK